MSIFLSNIDPEITKSLQYRQDLSNTRTQSGWFMDKQPWVRLTSMAGVIIPPNTAPDTELRKRWVLFGGMYGYDATTGKMSTKYASGFKELYNLNKYYYTSTDSNSKVPNLLTFDPSAMINNPIPGIISVDMVNKGTMGSVREATIKFTCWDLNQLDILENLYMTPGLSLLLEWGWNKDIYGKQITTNLSNLPPMHDYCLVKKASSVIKNTGGHYGAIQGRVVNFGWSYKSTGGFDAVIMF